MATEPVARFYLGANAPSGFYSLYHALIDPAQARRIYILKGGPGCGKSTLMKGVAKGVETAGWTVERIPCSGDPDSLDAIVVKEKGAALVDGTAPHVVEPNCPGAVDCYVNLGAGYDQNALSEVRSDLMATTTDYRGCYQRAYRCLTAAAQLYDEVRHTLDTPYLTAKMAKRARGIIGREFRPKGMGRGKSTPRFLSAVTHKGHLFEAETVLALADRVYELADGYGMADGLLRQLEKGALSAGYDVISCLNPLAPERLEHLIVPELRLAFVSTRSNLPYEGETYRRIRLDAMGDETYVNHHKPRLKFTRRLALALEEEAVTALAEAKAIHDELEAIYHPHMDFTVVDREQKRMLDEILSL